MEVPEEWLVIGRIAKTHGLKGGLKIHPLTDDPGRFLKLTTAVLEAPDGSRQACTFSDVRVDHRTVLISCQELSGLEQAERFVGGTVQLPQSQAVDLPPHSYFQYELMGMEVYLEDGRCLGVVREILPTGANDVLVVRDGGRERLIPAIRSIVSEVDRSGRRITLKYMDGLLEL